MAPAIQIPSEGDLPEDEDRDRRNSRELAKIERARIDALNQPAQGPTLLWAGPAKLVSTITGIASLSVRAGTKIGGWTVSAGRIATLEALELNRRILEGILMAAGKDVTSYRNGDFARAEADGVMARWIETLHSSISSVSFLAASGFYVTQTTIDTAAALSTQGLSMFNAVFGCTESSRAVAAILTLMQEEIKKPGSHGLQGNVTQWDFLLGLIAFLFLQRNGRRQTAIEFREAEVETPIWDIVIDDRGFRADVVGSNRTSDIRRVRSIVQSPIEQEPDHMTLVEHQLGSQTPVALTSEEQVRLTDEEIQERILNQLPTGASAVITSETVNLKTIKVEIHGGETTHIEAPPGMVMISEELDRDLAIGTNGNHQTVIFRTASKRVSTANVTPTEGLRLTMRSEEESDHQDAEDGLMMLPSPKRSSFPSLEQEELPEEPQEEVSLPSASTSAVANQKKSRKPVIHESKSPSPGKSKLPLPKMKKDKTDDSKPEKVVKPGVIKKALKSLSPTQSFVGVNRTATIAQSRRPPVPNSLSQAIRPLTREDRPPRIYPMSVTAPVTPSAASKPTTPSYRESSSYFAVHERRRESSYSQTDTYSVHSNESRPSSPTISRMHVRATNSIGKTHSQTDISMHENNRDDGESSSYHRRSRSFVPSLYSMGAKNDDESIILAPRTPMPRPSIFEDSDMITALATEGMVPGQFPKVHLVTVLRRYMRFASASYGSNFLKMFGLSELEKTSPKTVELIKKDEYNAHDSFSSYTGLPAHTILLSSFLDSDGLAPESKLPNSLAPLIHYVSIDHDSKAIVLSCRGTLGFEDLLTDMACGFSDIYWQGQKYQVHQGIRDSARRLVDGNGGNRIMATIKAALEEYPDFGLVLCGHSLGGAVAAVLAIMIAEPSPIPPGPNASDSSSFVTAKPTKLLPSTVQSSNQDYQLPIYLPAGRPIHVYAYGSPAAVSPNLRLATRGLITTVVNAHDIVPTLSLGTLHDFKAVAAHLKSDINNSFAELKTRIRSRLYETFRSTLFPETTSTSTDHRTAGFPPPSGSLVGDGLGEDNWAWDELVSLRSLMTNEKLVPPGEVFVLESDRVFDKLSEPHERGDGGETSEQRYYRSLGRPATRVQFKLVRDVEKRFAEIRFGRHMFMDHSPVRYESALAGLERGVREAL